MILKVSQTHWKVTQISAILFLTTSAAKIDQDSQGAFHYAKLTGQRSVGISEENGTTFPIKSGHPIAMDVVISNSFTEFPN